MEAETLGDEQGKVKVKALLNTLVDTQEAIKAELVLARQWVT